MTMLTAGKRQECVEREPGADRNHESQRARSVNERVGGVHDGRSEEHADGVQVVGGAGHDVARAVALVVGVGQAFEPGEEIVAKVEFDVAGNADDDPARQELEDPFGDGESEQDAGVDQEFVASHAVVKIVSSLAEHQREENPDTVGEENAERAREVRPSITLQVRQ